MPLVSFHLADQYYDVLVEVAAERGMYLEEMLRGYIEDRLLQRELAGN